MVSDAFPFKTLTLGILLRQYLRPARQPSKKPGMVHARAYPGPHPSFATRAWHPPAPSHPSGHPPRRIRPRPPLGRLATQRPVRLHQRNPSARLVSQPHHRRSPQCKLPASRPVGDSA